MTDDDWKKKLTPEQFRVLRQKGTEPPFTGEFFHNDRTGEYRCAACGSLLFKSDSQYDSYIPGLAGWPSFSQIADSGSVDVIDDDSYGMHRQEVICGKCGGHLGHLFPDNESSTGQHYCINSVALDFEEKKEAK